MFSAILKVTARRYKERNKLAHWVWGHSKALPDALLLADPRMVAAKIDKICREAVSHEEVQATLTAGRDHIYVYKEEDFLKIVADNERAAGYPFKLIWCLQRHPANEDGRIWRQICEAPEIAEILNPSVQS